MHPVAVQRVAGEDSAAGRPTIRRLLTVDDVRHAIAEVAAGRFGEEPPDPGQRIDDVTTRARTHGGPGEFRSGEFRSGEFRSSGLREVVPPIVPGPRGSTAQAALPVIPDGASPSLVTGASDCADEGSRGAGPEAFEGVPPGAGLLGLWSESVRDNDRRQAREAAQLAAFALARLLNRTGGEEALECFLTAASPSAESSSADAHSTVVLSSTVEHGSTDIPSGSDTSAGADTSVGADIPVGGGTDAAGSPEPADRGRDDSPQLAVVEFEDPRLTRRAGALPITEDLLIVSARLRKAKRATARQKVARAIVWFIGFHNLLTSVASGRLSFERIARVHFRIDDAMLPLDEVQALDRYLNALEPELSMDQFEKQMRKKIRTLVPVPEDPEAPRRNRDVRLERCDDDTGYLTLSGPIDVLDALYQRTRAVARAIRRRELSALGFQKDGVAITAAQVQDRLLDERTIAQLTFDLLVGARPQTRLGVRATVRPSDSRQRHNHYPQLFDDADLSGAAPRSEPVGLRDVAGRSESPGLSDAAGPRSRGGNSEWVEVLCPTEGSWLRKQAAVHVTVPASTLLGVNDAPGWTTGDATLSAARCRQIASYSTSWVRVLTDPVSGVVTDDLAQTYEPTASMRRTVRQKWRTCTAPGCQQPSSACEIDHCCSFSKKDPARGGQTVVENLHPLCKHHHQLKTMGRIRLDRVNGDEIVWVLPLGVRASAVPSPVGDTDVGQSPETLVQRAHDADGTEPRTEERAEAERPHDATTMAAIDDTADASVPPPDSGAGSGDGLEPPPF